MRPHSDTNPCCQNCIPLNRTSSDERNVIPLIRKRYSLETCQPVKSEVGIIDECGRGSIDSGSGMPTRYRRSGF